MSFGFYGPPQQQAILNKTSAEASFAGLLPGAMARKPSPIATFDLPGIYNVGWQAWWNAGAGAITMDADAAHQCGLAYWLGFPVPAGTPALAAQVDKILTAWATTSKVCSAENDSQLSFVENGAGFILADILIAGYSARPEPNAVAFLDWLGGPYLAACDAIKTRINNWGCAGVWGRLLASRHLGLDMTADVALLRRQLATMIDGNGVMTQEMLRVGAQLWYSYFAIQFLCLACRLVRNTGGPDLFRETPALTLALNNLAKMLANPNGTTGYPVNTAAQPWPCDLFQAMGEEFNNDAWRAIGQQHEPVSYWGHHTGFNVPHLTAVAGY